MNIGFVNQKGGVGKTTLALLFSDYLKQNEELHMCLDFDIQGSLYGKWSAANTVLSEEPPVSVIKCNLEDVEIILEELSSYDEYKIYDLPGSLDNPKVQDLLEAMDLIICPFLYEQSSFESTLIFAQIIADLKMKAKIIFVPNLVKANVRYDIVENVQKELSPYGKTAPQIKDWVDMQRLDYFNISMKQRDNVRNTFDFVRNFYLLIK